MISVQNINHVRTLKIETPAPQEISKVVGAEALPTKGSSLMNLCSCTCVNCVNLSDIPKPQKKLIVQDALFCWYKSVTRDESYVAAPLGNTLDIVEVAFTSQKSICTITPLFGATKKTIFTIMFFVKIDCQNIAFPQSQIL